LKLFGFSKRKKKSLKRKDDTKNHQKKRVQPKK